MIASAFTVGLIAVVTGVMQSRLGIQRELGSGGSVGLDVIAKLSVEQLASDLAKADRVRLLTPLGVDQWRTIQIRKPTMTTANCTGVNPPQSCFDDSANYRWVEYGLDTAQSQLVFYDNIIAGCGSRRVLSDRISAVIFGFADTTTDPAPVAPPPPGGEPFTVDPLAPILLDNNVVEYRITWDGIPNTATMSPRSFHGKVAIRAGAYTDLGADCPPAGPCDSGTGLGRDATVAPPPMFPCS